MPIITFASPKGGCGKSTSALLLATELAARNTTVTIIDQDPNHPLHDWAKKKGRPDNIEVLSRVTCNEDPDKDPRAPVVTNDRLPDLIADASHRSVFVIVDLEGIADGCHTHAMNMSDLVVIPVQLSQADIKQGVRAATYVNSVNKGRRLVHPNCSEVPYAMLITRAPTLQSKPERRLEKKLEVSGATMFKTRLVNRSPYKEILLDGGTLRTLNQNNSSVISATQNAEAYANEVIAMLNDLKQQQQEAAE